MTAGLGSHPVYDLPLGSLTRSRRARSRRTSSYDRSGRNEDWITVRPGETAVLLDHDGPGCVTHLYCAWMFPDLREYRNAILRCQWDGATTPSVEVPLGEFFGIVDARVQEFTSPLVSVNGGCGVSHGLNAYFPMPFASWALITIENRGATSLGGPWEALWYHVEYEVYQDALPADVELFHASFRLRPADMEPDTGRITPAAGGENPDYLVLETEGQGRMAGLLIGAAAHDRFVPEILAESVSVDGELLWATSEDFPGTIGNATLARPLSHCRWFDCSPIHFTRSLRWSVDPAPQARVGYASVAYWYQAPVGALPTLPPADVLLPTIEPGYDDAREALFDFVLRGSTEVTDSAAAAERFHTACRAGATLYQGDFDRATELVSSSRRHRWS